eukprot:3184228-Alexandrium_andersonii.AAC.1
MRPLDAQTLTRPNGAILAEEVATLLGARVSAVSRMVWAHHGRERAAHEAHGTCPFAPGDSGARLEWLSQVRAGRIRPHPGRETVMTVLTWMAQEMGQPCPDGRT